MSSKGKDGREGRGAQPTLLCPAGLGQVLVKPFFSFFKFICTNRICKQNAVDCSNMLQKYRADSSRRARTCGKSLRRPEPWGRYYVYACMAAPLILSAPTHTTTTTKTSTAAVHWAGGRKGGRKGGREGGRETCHMLADQVHYCILWTSHATVAPQAQLYSQAGEKGPLWSLAISFINHFSH